MLASLVLMDLRLHGLGGPGEYGAAAVMSNVSDNLANTFAIAKLYTSSLPEAAILRALAQRLMRNQCSL